MADPGEFLSGTNVRTAIVYIHGKGLRSLQYVEIDGRARVEGCIDIGLVAEVEAQNALLRNNSTAALEGNLEIQGVGIKGLRYRWKNEIIPYTIAANLPDRHRVTDAIAHWHQKTEIRLVPRAAEHEDYVTFQPGAGCSSSVGRQGGQQFVTLGPSCTTGNCVHEIGHTAGLWHEQSRADRDLFIRIRFENIISGMEHNFYQHIDDGIDLDRYDYGSIMHYPADAFSKNGQPTIETVQDKPIGQRDGLSPGDIAAVKELYP
jgi:Astacin (Peptidase family M12A)